jgi:RND superfamily putative drug exporter
MRLTGKATWWAPGPLRRFHDRFGLSEGEAREPAEAAAPDGESTAGPDAVSAAAESAPDPEAEPGRDKAEARG